MKKGPENERPDAEPHEALLAILGTRIREARKRAKLTQVELAKAIGSGQSYVYQIEAGEANVTVKTLLKIAEVMNLSPRDLLPEQNSGQVIQMLTTAIEDIDRIGGQLRRLRGLIAGDPSTTAPSTPPEG